MDADGRMRVPFRCVEGRSSGCGCGDDISRSDDSEVHVHIRSSDCSVYCM